MRIGHAWRTKSGKAEEDRRFHATVSYAEADSSTGRPVVLEEIRSL